MLSFIQRQKYLFSKKQKTVAVVAWIMFIASQALTADFRELSETGMREYPFNPMIPCNSVETKRQMILSVFCPIQRGILST